MPAPTLPTPPPSPAAAPARPTLRWVYPAAVALTVLIASSRSRVAGPEGIPHFDKVVHFCVFGLIATLLTRCLGLHRSWQAIGWISLYGLLDEVHQAFTPGRSAGVDDWLADTLGALLAVQLYRHWTAYRALLERPLTWPRRAKNQPATTLEVQTPQA